jgi:hypothetical protein
VARNVPDRDWSGRVTDSVPPHTLAVAASRLQRSELIFRCGICPASLRRSGLRAELLACPIGGEAGSWESAFPGLGPGL